MAIFQGLLSKLFPKPSTVSTEDINHQLTVEDVAMMRQFGTTMDGVQKAISDQVQVAYDRQSMYQNEINSLAHPIIQAAVDLFASTAVPLDETNNSSVYILSESEAYKEVLTSLLERINVEEHIYDWAYSISAHGSLFAKVEGIPNVGVIALDDHRAPIEYYRIENKGQLVGFVHAPIYSSQNQVNANLMPPWEMVHFRLNGGRLRRPMFGDMARGYRTSMIGIGSNTLQDSVNYGCSILAPAQPIYNRLRLAEDSLLMARATKGITTRAYLIGIDPKSGNMESIKSLIDNYRDIIKRSKILDTTSGNTQYSDRLDNIPGVSDLIIPVWGDVNSFKIQEIGGQVEVKWVVDIDELRNQLATALGVPLSLLGGYQQEGSAPGLGSSLERTDIRFSRSVSKVRRAVLAGIKRICQIHLSYLGMDPDPKLFDIQLGSASSAAEEEHKETLLKSTEAANNLIDTFVKIAGEDAIDRAKLFTIVNDKVLKMKDLSYSDISKTPVAPKMVPTMTESCGDLAAMNLNEAAKWQELYKDVRVNITKPEALNG